MILSCQNICKAFGEKVILNDASFHIEDREKAALIGCNGAGKTTLLRIIMQELSADSGTVVLARDKNIGYLAQYQDIHGHHTIYEELLTTKQHIIDMERRIRNMEQEMNTVTGDDLNRLMETYTRLTHQFELENGYAYKSELTGVLKGLGFTEEDYDKQIETLSGGQKTRVALGKMLLSKPDILLLDEPTNHLDMESISWLETYLLNYPGAVFIVSHDRYFLDRVVNRIFAFEGNGVVQQYEGGFTDYQRAWNERHPQISGNAGLGKASDKNAVEDNDPNAKAVNKNNWKETSGAQKKLRLSYKEQREWETIEGDIAGLEEAIAALETEIEKSASNYTRLNELMKEKTEKEAQLEEKMDRWMYLTDLVEQIESQK